MKKIKIIHIIEPVMGGTGKYISDLMLNIDLKKFDVSLAYSPIRMDTKFKKSIPVIHSRGINLIKINLFFSFEILKLIRTINQLRKIIRNSKSEMVILHCTRAGLIGRLSSFMLGVKVIYTPHLMLFLLEKKGFRRKFLKFYEKLFTPLTNKIICTSKSEYLQLKKEKIAVNKKLHYIFHGIKINDNNKNNIFNSSNTTTKIINVARVSSEKQPFYFIEVAKSIIEKNNNVKFYWVGDGKLLNDCRKKVDQYNLNNNISFLGYKLDVSKYYNESHIFFFPSKAESFGYVLCEAMEAKLPIIAQNSIGIKDLIAQDITGLLYDKNKMESTIKKIEFLIENKIIREKMGYLGRKRLEKLFSLERMIAETELYYKSIYFSNIYR